jgi:hypothetical protein
MGIEQEYCSKTPLFTIFEDGNEDQEQNSGAKLTVQSILEQSPIGCGEVLSAADTHDSVSKPHGLDFTLQPGLTHESIARGRMCAVFSCLGVANNINLGIANAVCWTGVSIGLLDAH